MLGLNSLASAIRGSLWLVRRGGLRQRLDELDQRLSELGSRFDGLVRDPGTLAGQLEQRIVPPLDQIEQRTARVERKDDARWSALGERLEAFARDLHGTAFRTEQGLSAIGETAQGGHDRAYEALRKVHQIDDLLRSRSRVFGHEMFLDPTDSIVSPMLLRDGYFEPYETTLIESEVKPGDVVLDIGANIGYYTLIFARLVGEKGRVYAFEPDPTNYRLLKKNVRANGYQNVIFVNKAVAETSGPLSLYLCPDNKGDHRIFESEDNRSAIPIEATTLDEHFAEYQGKIDFIKMDIQGSEGRAVRGMQGLLRKYRDVKIITEFWPAGLRRSGIEARDYLADLERQGFRLFRIDEDGETTESTTSEELLRLYPESREEFGNLYCARSA
jgi:FkbM family methyltransferase